MDTSRRGAKDTPWRHIHDEGLRVLREKVNAEMSTTAAARRVSKFTAKGRDLYYAQRRKERAGEKQGSLSTETGTHTQIYSVLLTPGRAGVERGLNLENVFHVLQPVCSLGCRIIISFLSGLSVLMSSEKSRDQTSALLLSECRPLVKCPNMTLSLLTLVVTGEQHCGGAGRFSPTLISLLLERMATKRQEARGKVYHTSQTGSMCRHLKM
ncbi:hypothetical protein PAMP_013938 [Pampus punctatissimus]